MSSIPPMDRLLRTLGAQAVRSAERVNVQRKITEKQPRRAEARSTAGTYLALKIREIRPDDPQRRRRAFRAFLEGGLANMFGQEAATDAHFQRVVDQVQDAMYANPEFEQAAERAADALLDAAASEDPALAQLTADLFHPG